MHGQGQGVLMSLRSSKAPAGALGCQGAAGDVCAAPTHPSLSWGQPPGHLRAIHLLNMLQAISFN